MHCIKRRGVFGSWARADTQEAGKNRRFGRGCSRTRGVRFTCLIERRIMARSNQGSDAPGEVHGLGRRGGECVVLKIRRKFAGLSESRRFWGGQ